MQEGPLSRHCAIVDPCAASLHHLVSSVSTLGEAAARSAFAASVLPITRRFSRLVAKETSQEVVQDSRGPVSEFLTSGAGNRAASARACLGRRRLFSDGAVSDGLLRSDVRPRVVDVRGSTWPMTLASCGAEGDRRRRGLWSAEATACRVFCSTWVLWWNSA